MATGLPLVGPPLQLQEEGQGVQLTTYGCMHCRTLTLLVLKGWLKDIEEIMRTASTDLAATAEL